MEYKNAWDEATLEEKKEMLENERKWMHKRIDDARDEERNDIIQDAAGEVNDALILYYTLEDERDLEKARNLWRAYSAIGLLTTRDWLFMNTRVKNLVAETEVKEREAAEGFRDTDAKRAEVVRQAEMVGKTPALRR